MSLSADGVRHWEIEQWLTTFFGLWPLKIRGGSSTNDWIVPSEYQIVFFAWNVPQHKLGIGLCAIDINSRLSSLKYLKGWLFGSYKLPFGHWWYQVFLFLLANDIRSPLPDTSPICFQTVSHWGLNKNNRIFTLTSHLVPFGKEHKLLLVGNKMRLWGGKKGKTDTDWEICFVCSTTVSLDQRLGKCWNDECSWLFVSSHHSLFPDLIQRDQTASLLPPSPSSCHLSPFPLLSPSS